MPCCGAIGGRTRASRGNSLTVVMNSHDGSQDQLPPQRRRRASLLPSFGVGAAFALAGVALAQWQRGVGNGAVEEAARAEAATALDEAQAEAKALADQRAAERHAHALQLRARLDAETAAREASAEAKRAELRAMRQAANAAHKAAGSARSDFWTAQEAFVVLWNERVAGRRSRDVEREDIRTVESALIAARRHLDAARDAFEAADAGYSATSNNAEPWGGWRADWQAWLDETEAWLRVSEREIAELG